MSEEQETVPKQVTDQTQKGATSVGKSMSWMFAARGLQAVVQLVSSAWIARLLSPSEIGLFAISFAALMVANGVRGLGVNQFLMQSKTIEKARMRSGFTLVFGFGVILCTGFNIAAAPLSEYYGQPAMGGMLHILSLNFIIFPFHMIIQTRAARALEFGFLASIEFASTLLSALVSVGLALLGYSYYALAAGMVSFLVIYTAICAMRHLHLSDFGFSISHIREAASYGGWIAGSTFVTMTGNAAPDLIVGKTLGISVAGLYDRAAAVNRMVWDQLYGVIGAVLFPTFASEKREGHEMGSVYLYRLRAISDFLWPALIWLAVFGDHAILLLYGTQWEASGPPARALALAAIASAPFFIGRELMFALGKTKVSFTVDLVTFFARIVVLTLAAPYGILVMALSFVIPNLVFTLVSQVALSRMVDISIGDILRAIWPPALMMTLYGMLMLILRDYLEALHITAPFMNLAVSGIVTLILAPFLLFFFRSPLVATFNKLRGRAVNE
ncbi:oligosaccharide flippase family protein [Kordiimonas sp.]|uniref:oligosaccharide flippase family protein n=1 Tax=Kordiimonas sp. TaxID=1970157 RepID=UPI003A9010C9